MPVRSLCARAAWAELDHLPSSLRLIGFQTGLLSRWHDLLLAHTGSLFLHPLEELVVVLANSDRIGMLRAERLLADCQRTLVERLSLLVLPPSLGECSQVLQRVCHIGVALSQHLLLDGKGPLEAWFGLLLPTL